MQNSTRDFSEEVIWVYIGQIPVTRVLSSLGLGSFRVTEARQCFLQSLRRLMTVWFTSDFATVSVTAKGPVGQWHCVFHIVKLPNFWQAYKVEFLFRTV